MDGECQALTVVDGDPGVVVAVAVDGRLTQVCATGRSTVDGATLGATTPFYVASVAKQLTAAVVATLVDDGAVALDDPVLGHLPRLSPALAPVRIRHLVHHTSGLAPLAGLDRDDDDPDATWWSGVGLDEIVRRQAGEGTVLEHAPGTVFRYANGGYRLLAAVVEAVTGRSFAAVAEERLLAPLGMRASTVAPSPDRVPRAAGHHRSDDGWSVDPRVVAFPGDGGLVTTAEDLARWTGALGGSTPWAARLAMHGTLDDGAALQYGWGLSLRTHRGLAMQSHGGRLVGSQAKLVRFPTLGVSLIGLANRDDVDLDAMVRDTADRVLAAHVDPAAPGWDETLAVDGRHRP